MTDDPNQDYDAALSDAIQHTAERVAQQSARQEASGLPPQVKWAAVAVLAALSAWLWLAPPAVLQPPAPMPFTPEMAQTSVRMDMFVQASRILNFQEENGVLPETAAEAGDVVDGVTYQLLDAQRFRLVGTSGNVTYTWTSDQPGEALLGDAPAQVLRGAADASSN